MALFNAEEFYDEIVCGYFMIAGLQYHSLHSNSLLMFVDVHL